MANGGKSTHKLKILYAEDDAEVIVGQAVSIQKAGHHVTQALGRSGALDALDRDAFDLVVLGPTLTRNDRHHLPYMVKKTHPGTRVLVMHTDGERHPQVDANLETGKSIDDLVAKIAVMLEQDAVSQ
jgi:DNA-binding NtrC family response regulator